MKTHIIVSVVAAVLSILILILGISAEVKRVKVVYVKSLYYRECYRDPGPAFGLASAASIFLLAGHVLLNGASCCFCLARNKFWLKNRGLVISLGMIAWVAFLTGQLYLVSGAEYDRGIKYACSVAQRGYFIIGTLAGVASLIIGVVAYFISISSQSDNLSSVNSPAGVAMAYPNQYSTYPNQSPTTPSASNPNQYPTAGGAPA